jgi:LysM repeat protein
MRQAKRVFYMILLNVIISIITVGVILTLWERDHPPLSAETTPLVIVVTATPAAQVPLVSNSSASGAFTPAVASPVITGTLQASPTLEILTYRVKEGDTLGALAVQFNVYVDDIIDMNELENPDSLIVGQILYIPTSPLPRITDTAVPPTYAASLTPRPSRTPTLTHFHTATVTPTGQPAQVVIDTVIGAGVLQNERVVLRRTGDGELLMAGWRLTGDKGTQYTFPQLTLYKDGAINLNTRKGLDTVVDLYWGLTTPIWSPGTMISLYDAQENLRATYTVP